MAIKHIVNICGENEIREVNLTPIKAIRLKCLDCTAGQPKIVRECHINDCPLWPYRMGRRPKE